VLESVGPSWWRCGACSTASPSVARLLAMSSGPRPPGSFFFFSFLFGILGDDTACCFRYWNNFAFSYMNFPNYFTLLLQGVILGISPHRPHTLFETASFPSDSEKVAARHVMDIHMSLLAWWMIIAHPKSSLSLKCVFRTSASLVGRDCSHGICCPWVRVGVDAVGNFFRCHCRRPINPPPPPPLH
jgi:hypothetical protein